MIVFTDRQFFNNSRQSLEFISFVRREPQDQWTSEESTSIHYRLISVSSGKLKLRHSSSMLTLEKNDLFLVSPKTTVYLYRHTDRVTFDFVDFDMNLEEYQNLCLFHASISRTRRLSELYSLLAEQAMGLSNYPSQEVLDATLLLVLEGFRHCVRAASKDFTLTEDIISYIRSQLSDTDLSVSKIAAHFFYSADHLNRIFRKSYGITLREYLINLKIRDAKQLLSTTNLSIAQIAAQLGYEDANLFTKFFIYHEKISPRQFRTVQPDKIHIFDQSQQ